MKNIFVTLLIVGVSLLLAGCAANSPVQGMYYTGTAFPSGDKVKLDAESDEMQGKSSCYSILYLIAFGNCGIDKAMENGGITKVHHVDNKAMNILFLFVKYDTVVYGE